MTLTTRYLCSRDELAASFRLVRSPVCFGVLSVPPAELVGGGSVGSFVRWGEWLDGPAGLVFDGMDSGDSHAGLVYALAHSAGLTYPFDVMPEESDAAVGL